MLKVTRIYTRPNVEIPWHGEVLLTRAVSDRLQYHRTGGVILQENQEISLDGLTLTYTGYFQDQSTFDVYDTDPALQQFWNDRISYCNMVGITIGPKQFDTVDSLPS